MTTDTKDAQDAFTLALYKGTQMDIKDTRDAFTLALYLAITASTDERSSECISIARRLSVNLTDEEIEQCKDLAVAKSRQDRAEVA